MEMEVRRIVVVVEDVEVARTTMIWALHNVLRYGDLVTLLHVFPANTTTGSKSRNKKKLRLLRLKGFQLALSFKDICIHSFPNKAMKKAVESLIWSGRLGLQRWLPASMIRAFSTELPVNKIDELKARGVR